MVLGGLVADSGGALQLVPGEAAAFQGTLEGLQKDDRKQLAIGEALQPDLAEKPNVLASIGGLPTGRLTTPEEVATLAVLLASPLTANVTGSNYVVDGGLIKTT